MCSWQLHGNLRPCTSSHETPSHALTAEEELLRGATLPCSPWQEANLLSPSVVLMDNHIKMMDALHHLDSYGLQFICESAEALHREKMPTQAPLCYHMLQASDILHGWTSKPPLSQEFYRAANNLGTAIVEPQQVPPQLHLAGNCHPDPEIESTIANMYRHEQASGMLPIDSNNNPCQGHGLSCPYSHATLEPVAIYPVPQEARTEDRRPKAQDCCSLATSFLPYTLVTFWYYLDFYIFLPHVFFFRKKPCKCVRIMQ